MGEQKVTFFRLRGYAVNAKKVRDTEDGAGCGFLASSGVMK